MRNNSKSFTRLHPYRKHITPRTHITVGELSDILLKQARQAVGDNAFAILLTHHVLNKIVMNKR